MFEYNDKYIMRLVNTISILVLLSLTIGFSAFQNNLLVSDVGAIVRRKTDIRVTNVYTSSNANGGISYWEDYNISNISSSIELPNSNSSITYSVEITNIGNTEMGILDITGLASNLKYNISGYTLKNKLCDDNNSSKCSLGSITTLDITISYNNGGYNSSNTEYQMLMNFDFREVYTITYNGFSSISGLPTTILNGESKNISFTSTNGIPSAVDVNNAVSNYTSPTLNISNATSNVIITRKYTITYVDFTGNTSGLVSSMSGSGGTITFNSTTGIPDSVTVTGATGSYTSPTLNITNVTGDISITSITNTVSNLGYETLINIYNNSTASTDSTCDNSLLRDNTTDTNLRFTGNKPCNYVYFNCSDVDNPTSSTCEKWRIIGVFNKNNHQVLKIINSTFYNSGGNVQFNSANNSSGVLWGTNTLSTTFNTTYYNSMAHTDNHDFIENVNWSIGATTNLGVKPAVLYTAENASITSSSLPFGLLSVTDINYGTSVTSCYDTTVNRWGSSCMTKASYDWLFEGNEYTLIPYSTTSYYVYKMQTNYQPYRTVINTNLPARVVTYLKNNVYFDGGVGSESNPYKLKLYNG